MNKLFSFGLGVIAVSASVAGAVAASQPDVAMRGITEQRVPERVASLQLQSASETPRVLRSERVRKASKVPAEYVGRKFYGSVVYSDYITFPTYGLYEFTITEESVDHAPKAIGMSLDWMSGARLRDRFYGVRAVSMFGKLTDVGYEEVDIVNNKVLRTEFRGEGSYAALAATMAPDFTDGKIYGIMYNAELTGLNLAEFDAETLDFKVTGRFGGRFNPLTFAAAPNGKLYTISPDGDLYTVDKKTGRVSLVDYTGVNVAAYNQSMTWDSKTNKFLWAAVTPVGSKLYALDPETAETTFITNIPDNTQIAGIYLEQDEQAPASPAKVTDLAFNWSTPGSQSGTLTFTVPAVDGVGANINGNVEVSVWLDSEVLKEQEVFAPGATVTIPVDVTNTMHQAAVSIKSGNGYAPWASIYEWAGFDCPKAVTDLTFNATGRDATVTWTAATESEHGGYLDPAKVVYNVWRLPDNVQVAENLSATVFTETLPEAVQQYSYRVVPVNTDATSIPGKAAVSNVLVAGEAYTVPYYENWAQEGSEQLFGYIDNDGDGNKWIWYSWNRNWNFTNPYQGTGQCDDWFISPLVSLEKDKVYRFVSNLRNSFMTGKEYIDLAYGTSVSDVSTYTKYGNWVLENGEDTDRECTFEVPETGRYHMALVNVTQKTKGSSVLLNSIGVELVGSAFAPAAPEEFKISPDLDRECQATLTFVAPSVDMRGNALSGTLTAKIYRDGNLEVPVHVMENVAVGAACEWLDNTVATSGTHKYSVLFENSYGAGMPAVGSAFIGIYTAPYTEACATKAALKDFKLDVVGFTYEEQFSPLALSYSTTEPAFELTHFNTTEESHDMHVFFPDMLFNSESVYKLNIDFKNNGYSNEQCVYEMRLGTEPDKDFQNELVGKLPNNTLYQFQNQEFVIVNTERMQKNLSMYVSSRRKNDYTNIAFRNISLVYDGSALAPDSVTNLNCASEESAVINFTTPAVDYALRELGSLQSIEIYRNGQAIAAKVFDNITPGEDISWVDDNAILGKNKYMIVPVNEYGRGRPAYVEAFIGFDVPSTPANVGITPSDDNQTARIDWSRVKRGVNGGVLSEPLTYKIVQAVQGEEAVEYITVKEGLTGTSYTLERTPTDTQAMEFYGVVAVTAEGESVPGLYYTILGKPYELPFKESFPKGEATTGPWIGMHAAGALQSGPTASEGMATMNTYPQDEDGGSFFFMNGTMMDFELTIPVLTPKVTLKDAESGELRFWLYKGNHSGTYAANPMFSTFASYNEGEFELLGYTEWDETFPEWIEYVYNLDKYVGKPGNVIFQLVCRANGYLDFVVMDNFRVQEVDNSSATEIDSDDISVFGLKDHLLTRGAQGKRVEVYATDGRMVDSFVGTDTAKAINSGIYVVRVAGRSFKVTVK